MNVQRSAENDAWRGRLTSALVARGDVYAVVGELLAEAWDEGERHESDYLSTWGQFCPSNNCNPYRVTSPGGPDV